MVELLLEIGYVNSSIQSPTAEAMPQQIWRESLSLPHLARSCLLKTYHICPKSFSSELSISLANILEEMPWYNNEAGF